MPQFTFQQHFCSYGCLSLWLLALRKLLLSCALAPFSLCPPALHHSHHSVRHALLPEVSADQALVHSRCDKGLGSRCRTSGVLMTASHTCPPISELSHHGTFSLTRKSPFNCPSLLFFPFLSLRSLPSVASKPSPITSPIPVPCPARIIDLLFV